MPVAEIAELSREERINLVLLAYKYTVNPAIVADGVVGKEAIKAVQDRRDARRYAKSDINLLVLAHKVAGHNDNLVADGVMGEELWKAEQVFITGKTP